MPDYAAVGERIRALRLRLGISQEQLAEQCGISKNHLSHVENGNTKGSTPTFLVIANALHVGLDDLFCDSLDSEVIAYQKEIAAVTADCTPLEIRMLADLMRAAKETMRKHHVTDEREQ